MCYINTLKTTSILGILNISQITLSLCLESEAGPSDLLALPQFSIGTETFFHSDFKYLWEFVLFNLCLRRKDTVRGMAWVWWPLN